MHETSGIVRDGRRVCRVRAACSNGGRVWTTAPVVLTSTNSTNRRTERPVTDGGRVSEEPKGELEAHHRTASDCVTRRTSAPAPTAAASQLSLAQLTLPFAMYSLRPAMVTAADAVRGGGWVGGWCCRAWRKGYQASACMHGIRMLRTSQGPCQPAAPYCPRWLSDRPAPLSPPTFWHAGAPVLRMRLRPRVLSSSYSKSYTAGMDGN